MSARSREITLTAEARRDLSDIQLFTELRWGGDQRIEYAAKLDHAIKELIRYPDLGRIQENVIPAGLRARAVERHVVYYRVSDQYITIVRILHSQMDAKSQFEQ